MSKVTIQCERCPERFEVSSSRASRFRVRFCSMACRRKPATRTCEHCGIAYELINRGAREMVRRCCSRECDVARRSGLAAGAQRVEERFFSKVDELGPVPEHCPELGRCHVWLGSRSAAGYGQFELNGAPELAHRVAFFLRYGRWPEPCALHKCDGGTIGCVRSDHLFEGTKRDNTSDMMRKGRNRHKTRIGEHSPSAVLTDEIVLDARHKAAMGVSLTVLAKAHGVSLSAMHAAVTGKSWKHLT